MQDITVTELKAKLESGDKFLFLDVREPAEYQESNLGATLIPLGSLIARVNELMPDKDNEIIIHCRSGARSGSAKITLEQLGFTKVRNVLGGIMEWHNQFGK